eukprot:GHVQ01022838.1.p1 GENE.GHVQ01022838.1~~GHVQ01022838.1.p1  ORF type:complete len:528 (-),score=36.98 GHVQ01022838.1:355-1938(-)
MSRPLCQALCRMFEKPILLVLWSLSTFNYSLCLCFVIASQPSSPRSSPLLYSSSRSCTALLPFTPTSHILFLRRNQTLSQKPSSFGVRLNILRWLEIVTSYKWLLLYRSCKHENKELPPIPSFEFQNSKRLPLSLLPPTVRDHQLVIASNPFHDLYESGIDMCGRGGSAAMEATIAYVSSVYSQAHVNLLCDSYFLPSEHIHYLAPVLSDFPLNSTVLPRSTTASIAQSLLTKVLLLPLSSPLNPICSCMNCSFATLLESRSKSSRLQSPLLHYSVDFLSGRNGHRTGKTRVVGEPLSPSRLAGENDRRKELVVRACTSPTNRNPLVWDMSAGLGRDSLVLASVGCRVRLLECNPIVASLLAGAKPLCVFLQHTCFVDGLERLRDREEYLWAAEFAKRHGSLKDGVLQTPSIGTSSRVLGLHVGEAGSVCTVHTDRRLHSGEAGGVGTSLTCCGSLGVQLLRWRKAIQGDPTDGAGRICLRCLQQKLNEVPDVLYFDPMFAERKNSSRVSDDRMSYFAKKKIAAVCR